MSLSTMRVLTRRKKKNEEHTRKVSCSLSRLDGTQRVLGFTLLTCTTDAGGRDKESERGAKDDSRVT